MRLFLFQGGLKAEMEHWLFAVSADAERGSLSLRMGPLLHPRQALELGWPLG